MKKLTIFLAVMFFACAIFIKVAEGLSITYYDPDTYYNPYIYPHAYLYTYTYHNPNTQNAEVYVYDWINKITYVTVYRNGVHIENRSYSYVYSLGRIIQVRRIIQRFNPYYNPDLQGDIIRTYELNYKDFYLSGILQWKRNYVYEFVMVNESLSLKRMTATDERYRTNGTIYYKTINTTTYHPETGASPTVEEEIYQFYGSGNLFEYKKQVAGVTVLIRRYHDDDIDGDGIGKLAYEGLGDENGIHTHFYFLHFSGETEQYSLRAEYDAGYILKATYEYSIDGMLIAETQYHRDGQLMVFEYVYDTVDNDGNGVGRLIDEKRKIGYYDISEHFKFTYYGDTDQCRFKDEYDANGNIVKSSEYDANGNLIGEATFERFYWGNGKLRVKKITNLAYAQDHIVSGDFVLAERMIVNSYYNTDGTVSRSAIYRYLHNPRTGDEIVRTFHILNYDLQQRVNYETIYEKNFLTGEILVNDQISYHYDEDFYGNLASKSITDRNGNQVVYTYGRDWTVTRYSGYPPVGSTTFLKLDSAQFRMTFNGNTFLYDRNTDSIMRWYSSDLSGSDVCIHGYGTYLSRIGDMAYFLGQIGENQLASDLESGLLYNDNPDRRSWEVTTYTGYPPIGTTTFLTLDPNQFHMSYNGNTYLYNRNHDTLMRWYSSDLSGSEVYMRGYGTFQNRLDAMIGHLRNIGETQLADDLVLGALYNDDPTRREWTVTLYSGGVQPIGDSTFLTLDSHMLKMSCRGTTFLYDRYLNTAMKWESSDLSGSDVYHAGYGTFANNVDWMVYMLRYIGEDQLADRLDNGELYNYADPNEVNEDFPGEYEPPDQTESFNEFDQRLRVTSGQGDQRVNNYFPISRESRRKKAAYLNWLFEMN